VNVQTAVVGPFEVNCHVLWDGDMMATVVDPGSDPGRIAGILKRHGLSVSRYLLTHGHCDHVSAAEELARLFPAPVRIHPADGKWAFTGHNNYPPYYDAPAKPATLEFLSLTSDDGLLPFTVIPTPGHSPGSVCYYLQEEGILLSGDTLFKGSVGRTDFEGGDSRKLAASIRAIAALPDGTRVLTGHGDETTIGAEKATNYFMRGT
jgi:hydroxyacylglutathione hydrolase